jgi:hypothetical protein
MVDNADVLNVGRVVPEPHGKDTSMDRVTGITGSLLIIARAVGVETKAEQLLATFTSGEPPGREWIQSFKDRAGDSVLNITAATFRRNRLSVEVPGRALRLRRPHVLD